MPATSEPEWLLRDFKPLDAPAPIQASEPAWLLRDFRPIDSPAAAASDSAIAVASPPNSAISMPSTQPALVEPPPLAEPTAEPASAPLFSDPTPVTLGDNPTLEDYDRMRVALGGQPYAPPAGEPLPANPSWQPSKIPQKLLDEEAARVASMPEGPDRDESARNLDEARYQNFRIDNTVGNYNRDDLHMPARRIVGALSNISRTLQAAAYRAIGGEEYDKVADDITRERGYVNRLLGELDSDAGGEALATTGSVGQSLVEVALTRGAMLPYLFASNADTAYVEGKDAGMSESEAAMHGTATGAIQAGLTWLFGKLAGKVGGKTAEEALQNPAMEKAAERLISKHGLKQLGIDFLGEAGEEGTIAAIQQLEDMRVGKSDGRDFWKNIGKSAAVGGITGATVHASLHSLNKAMNRFQQEAPVVAEAVAAAEKWAEKATPAQMEAAASATSRGAFTQATGQQRSTQQWREAFTGEVKRRLGEQQQQATSEPPLLEGTQEPPVAPGMVRMYHGGGAYEGGARWLTPDRKYAQGYANKGTEGAFVHYVDIPQDSPLLVKAFDDSGTNTPAPYKSFDAPEDIARQLRPLPQPRTDNPAPAERPFAPPTIDRRTLAVLDRRVQSLREAGSGLDIDAFDELLSHDPQRLTEVFAEADRRAAEHNLEMNQARREWGEVFGDLSAEKVAAAKRGAASDGDSTFAAWDQIVNRVTGESAGGEVRYPNILAAAQSLGGGDVESGLFSLLQESRKYFGNKGGDEFVGGVLDEAMADAVSFDFGASDRLPIDDLPAFSGVPLNVTIDLGQMKSAFSRGRTVFKKWLTKNFTSDGGVRPEIMKAVDARRGRIAREMKALTQLRKDLDRTVWGQYGRTKTISPEIREQIDAALKGQQTNLPAPILAAIAPMRAHVDKLSRELRDSGIASDSLELTIDENMGYYLTRTYRKHSEKGWAEKAKANPQLMKQTRDWLAEQFPEDSPSDIDWRINMLLDKDSADAKDVPKKFARDAKFHSILMKRQDLPKQLLDLYGEYRDPWINYTRSVTKMAQLLGHHEMMQSVREAGLAAGFLTEVPRGELKAKGGEQQGVMFPTSTSKNSENYRRIDGSKNRLLEPLDGLFTDPDTAQSLDELFSPEAHATMYRWMVGASAYAKWAATVGNSKTYIRNFLGNVVFAMANGDIVSRHWGKSASATVSNVLTGRNHREYLRHLAELGIVDADVHISELRAMLGDLADSDAGPDVLTAGIIKRTATRSMAGLNNVYQSMDTIWKINAFEHKKEQFALAYPGRSSTEIEKLAADDVKAHYPTYSKAPKGVRKISKFPLFAPFVTFYSEVLRTRKNNLATAWREIRSDNPQLRKMGRQRILGNLAAIAMFQVASQASKMIFGVDDEEDRELRRFQPPWTRNSDYLYTSNPGDGTYGVLDLGFMNPLGIVTKPINALLGPGSTEEKVEQAIHEAVAPVATEDLLFGRLVSVWRNRTADGRRVYDEGASRERQSKQIAQYLGQALVPGTIQQLQRVQKGVRGEVSKSGKPYDPMMEFAALFGLRTTPVDVRQSLGYRSGDFRQQLRESEAGIRRAATDRSSLTGADVAEAYRDFDSQRRKIVAEWHDTAMAAIKLGVPVDEVRRAVYSAANSNRLTDQVMGGAYLPYVPSEETLQLIRATPNGKERVDAILAIVRAGNVKMDAKRDKAAAL